MVAAVIMLRPKPAQTPPPVVAVEKVKTEDVNIYGEYVGAIDIQTGKMLEGDLPNKALLMVQEWTKQYQEDLLTIWNTQQFKQLPPLV